MRFAIAVLLVTLAAAPASARGHASSSKHSSDAGHEHAVSGGGAQTAAPPPGHETSRYEKSVKSSQRAYDKPNVKALNRAIQAPVAAGDKGTAGKDGGDRGAAGVSGAAGGSVKGGGK